MNRVFFSSLFLFCNLSFQMQDVSGNLCVSFLITLFFLNLDIGWRSYKLFSLLCCVFFSFAILQSGMPIHLCCCRFDITQYANYNTESFHMHAQIEDHISKIWTVSSLWSSQHKSCTNISCFSFARIFPINHVCGSILRAHMLNRYLFLSFLCK